MRCRDAGLTDSSRRRARHRSSSSPSGCSCWCRSSTWCSPSPPSRPERSPSRAQRGRPRGSRCSARDDRRIGCRGGARGTRDARRLRDRRRRGIRLGDLRSGGLHRRRRARDGRRARPCPAAARARRAGAQRRRRACRSRRVRRRPCRDSRDGRSDAAPSTPPAVPDSRAKSRARRCCSPSSTASSGSPSSCVVASATTLYLERKRLFTSPTAPHSPAPKPGRSTPYEIDGDRLAFDLRDDDVRRAAADYLATAATELDEVELVRAASDDGRTATVTLRSVWRAPLSTELVPLTVPIEVTVTARSVFH